MSNASAPPPPIPSRSSPEDGRSAKSLDRTRQETFLHAFAVALILICGSIAYSNAVTDIFVGLDARESIRDNPYIRSLWPPGNPISLPMWGSAPVVEQSATVSYRPVFSLALSLTYHLFGGSAGAFHILSIAIHLLAAIVLLEAVRLTAKNLGIGAVHSIALGCATSLLWALHPLQTESVTYVVQSSESLMGLFVLLTLYCSIRARDSARYRGWTAAAVAAAAAAIGSKQSAVALPLLLLLYDHTFAPPPGSRRYRPMLYAATALPVAVITALILHGVRSAARPQRALDYALAQPGVIAHYLRLTFWPDELFLYVNTDLFRVTSAYDALLPAALLALFLLLTMAGLSRRHWAGYAGAWFFLTLGPTSSVLAISDRIQEHRMYLPLAAISLLVAVGGDCGLDRFASWLAVSDRARRILKGLALLAAGLALGIRTHDRNSDYHHEFTAMHPADLHEAFRINADHVLSDPRFLAREATLARRLLAASDSPPPDRRYAHFILGLAASESGNFAAAERELRQVLEDDPEFAYAHHCLGRIFMREGRARDAIREFRAAIRLEPDFPYSYVDLGRVLVNDGDPVGAKQWFEDALHAQPGFAEAHFELGILALQENDNTNAAAHFQRAVTDRPDFADARYELALLQRDAGALDQAFENLEAAVHYAPNDAAARYELGRLLIERGRSAEGEDQLRAAIRSQPKFADPYRELAALLLRNQNVSEASALLEQAIRIDPNSAQGHYLLGMARLAQGEVRDSVAELRRAADLAPDEPDVWSLLGITLIEAGDETNARRHLHHALALDPNQKQAREALRRLDKRHREGAATPVPLPLAPLTLSPTEPPRLLRVVSQPTRTVAGESARRG